MTHGAIQMGQLKFHVIKTTYAYIAATKGVPYINVHYDTAIEFDGNVPKEYFNEHGIMAFDLSPNACASVRFDTDKVDDIDKIWLTCSFKQVLTDCVIPMVSITSIFDRDSMEGLQFRVLDDAVRERNREKRIEIPKKERPKLTIVKK